MKTMSLTLFSSLLTFKKKILFSGVHLNTTNLKTSHSPLTTIRLLFHMAMNQKKQRDTIRLQTAKFQNTVHFAFYLLFFFLLG